MTITATMLGGMVALLALNGQLYAVDTFHLDLRRNFDTARSLGNAVSNRW